MDSSKPTNAPWMTWTLSAGGIHSILWGAAIILFPAPAARVYGLAQTPHDLFLWQGTGLVIVLFGTGYLIAASNPLQHWAVVLVGLLAKALGPVGMTMAVVRGEVSANVLWLLPVNDLIWWLPFGVIVLRGWNTTRG